MQVDADVLLVDEVLAVGDEAFQQKCSDQFQRLKAADKTIMFVTHDMGAVERFCDRALLMERGGLGRPRHPVHAGAALGGADRVSHSAREARADRAPGRRAEPGESAVRLSIPDALLEGAGDLRRGGAGARPASGRRASRRVSLRRDRESAEPRVPAGGERRARPRSSGRSA